MATVIGQMMPCVAHTAVDIAVQKQQLQMELQRTLHSNLPPGAEASLLTQGPRASSFKVMFKTNLPAEIAKANIIIDATSLTQLFARCFFARRLRVVQAGKRIAHWTLLKVTNSLHRKRTLQAFKRARQADERLLRAYFTNFVQWRSRRLEAKRISQVIVRHNVVERRVFGVLGAKQLTNSVHVGLTRSHFRRWRALVMRRFLAKRVETMRLVNERRHLRSRLQAWSDSFTDGKIHFGPELRRLLAALRLERKNKSILRERYLGKLMNFFVASLQSRERQLELYQAYHVVRRQHIAKEVDRVWCIAMIKSGWARKYFKQGYHHWREWLLQRKPHLAKKRKPLYNL
jgi:hypothetical protein